MIETLTQYPFQAAGSDYLSDPARMNRALGDEPGLGKTNQAIVAADRIGARHILVLCKSVGRAVWLREFLRWQNLSRPVAVVATHKTGVPDKGVVIVSYDLIQRGDSTVYTLLMKQNWDLLILDEADALKNPSAVRTQRVYGKACDLSGGLAAKAKRIWPLSGTLVPNNAGELWTHLRALAPDLIQDPRHPGVPMEKHVFLDRYCTTRATPYGRVVTGSKNLMDLRPRLEKFMLRRRKKDVLPDLPPLLFDTLPLVLGGQLPAGLENAFRDAEHKAIAEIAEYMGFKDDGPSIETAMGSNIAEHRKLAGAIKAHYAVEIAASELGEADDNKIILFAIHHDTIDLIMAGFRRLGIGAVKIDGRDSEKVRDSNIDAFQNNPEVRVFVGQVIAAGTSITLTAAKDVLFVEPSYVPRDNVQAASRAHRIGQKDGVLARYLTLAGSIDERIMTVLRHKSNQLAVLLDDDAENMGVPSEPEKPKTKGKSPFTPVV